nr:hypothetical protein [Tanacetum cinerariifolium]
MQIAQPGMNMGQDRQMQMIGEGNAAGQNANQIRCYNCRGLGHYARNCTARPRRRDAAYLQTQLLIAQKEEAGIQLQAEEYDLMAAAADLDEIEEVNANCILMANLQQASSSGTQTDSALVYDSDRSTEVHESFDNNEIFNMFTQEEQYTELLEPIPEPQHVPQNDNNVISEVTDVEQDGETVEQHPANFEETRALYESLYQNLAVEVEIVNSIQDPLALMANSNNPYASPAPRQDLSPFNQNYMQQPMPNPDDITDFTTTINMALALMAKAFKLNYSTPTNNNRRISSNPRNRQIAQPALHQDLSPLNQNFLQQPITNPEDITDPTTAMNMALALMAKAFKLNYSTPTKTIRGFHQTEGTGRLLNRVAQNPRVQNVGTQNGFIGVQGNGIMNQIGNGNLVAARAEENAGGQNANQIRCYNCRGLADLDDIEEVNANCILMANLQQASSSVEQHSANFEETRALYESLYQNLVVEVEKVNSVNRKLKETNADLTTELARGVTANLQQASTSGTQTDSAPVYDTDGSVKVHENCDDNEIFNMFTQEEQYTELLEPIPESHQVPHNDNNVIFADTSVEQGLRPQPRSNTKNDRVPSASKSSQSKNKEVKVEEHHRNLLLSKKNKHSSSACNSSKIDSHDEISKVVCAMYKKCLISVNHDESLVNYMNGKKSHGGHQLADYLIKMANLLLPVTPRVILTALMVVPST